MDRKRTGTISALMMLIIIGAMLLPGAMGSTGSPTDFTITISSGQNTAVTTNTSTAFSAALAGSTNEIADSFDLTNVGNVESTVNAKFTTFRTTTYGLNGSTSVIPGTAFSMSEVVADSYVALAATDTGTPITGSNVAADAAVDVWKVKLIVPSGQVAEAYTGTIELTFADA